MFWDFSTLKIFFVLTFCTANMERFVFGIFRSLQNVPSFLGFFVKIWIWSSPIFGSILLIPKIFPFWIILGVSMFLFVWNRLTLIWNLWILMFKLLMLWKILIGISNALTDFLGHNFNSPIKSFGQINPGSLNHWVSLPGLNQVVSEVYSFLNSNFDNLAILKGWKNLWKLITSQKAKSHSLFESDCWW